MEVRCKQSFTVIFRTSVFTAETKEPTQFRWLRSGLEGSGVVKNLTSSFEEFVESLEVQQVFPPDQAVFVLEKATCLNTLGLSSVWALVILSASWNDAYLFEICTEGQGVQYALRLLTGTKLQVHQRGGRDLEIKFYAKCVNNINNDMIFWSARSQALSMKFLAKVFK